MRFHLKLFSIVNVVFELNENQLTTYNYIIIQFVFFVAKDSRIAIFFIIESEKIDKSFFFSKID